MSSYRIEDNASRVARADAIINLAHNLQGGDYQDALIDLLADLMHWAGHNGADFWEELERARRNYEAETTE